MRNNFAELCYYYPQYKIDDFTEGGQYEELPVGDIELLLNVAHKLYYEDKLDTLYVTTGAQSKKGFLAVKNNLTNIIKKIKARI